MSAVCSCSPPHFQSPVPGVPAAGNQPLLAARAHTRCTSFCIGGGGGPSDGGGVPGLGLRAGAFHHEFEARAAWVARTLPVWRRGVLAVSLRSVWPRPCTHRGPRRAPSSDVCRQRSLTHFGAIPPGSPRTLLPAAHSKPLSRVRPTRTCPHDTKRAASTQVRRVEVVCWGTPGVLRWCHGLHVINNSEVGAHGRKNVHMPTCCHTSSRSLPF